MPGTRPGMTAVIEATPLLKLARTLQTRVFDLTFALPVLWSRRLLSEGVF